MDNFTDTVSVAGMAQQLGVSLASAYRYVHGGKVTTIRTPLGTLIPSSEVHQLQTQRRQRRKEKANV